MPIAHRYQHVRVERLSELAFKGPRLPLGKLTDGRLPADAGVVLLHLAGASRGNQLGQHGAGQAGKGKIDDIRIEKQVIEEGFDGRQRVRSAQLEQNHADGITSKHCRLPIAVKEKTVRSTDYADYTDREEPVK